MAKPLRSFGHSECNRVNFLSVYTRGTTFALIFFCLSICFCMFISVCYIFEYVHSICLFTCMCMLLRHLCVA